MQTKHKHHEQIMQRPLQRLRGLLVTAFGTGTFGQEEMEVFFAQAAEIIKTDFQTLAPQFQTECDKVRQMLASGKAGKADLSDPLLQLLWAAGLAAETSGAPDAGSPSNRGAIRKQIEQHPVVETYRKLFAFEMESSFPGASHIRLGWTGDPKLHVSHHFNLDQRFIGMDILYSLAMGLSTERISIVNKEAHTAADIMHEIAHGIGTRFTRKMQAVRKKMEAIKQPVVSQEDYIALAKLQAEWGMRFTLFDAAENNYANKFSANRANSVNPYDYAINCTQAVYDSARPYQPNDPPTAGDILDNLMRAIDSSFFKNNQLFDDTKEGWQKRNIVPEWISCKNAGKSGKRISGMRALKILMGLCQKLETLQPTARDKWLPAEKYQERVQRYTDARNAIIDQIYERFASHLLPEQQKKTEEQVKQQMQQVNSSSPEPQEEGGATPEGKSPPKNSPPQQENKGTQDKKDPTGDKADKKESKPDTAPSDAQPPKEGGKGKPQEASPGSGPKEGEPQDTGPGQGNEAGDGTMTVIDIGKMPEIKLPPETRHIVMPGEDIDEGKTVGELMQEFIQPKEASPGEKEAPPGTKFIAHRPDTKMPTLDEPIRPGEWSEYLQIVAANAATIRQVERMRDEIQKRQIILDPSRSRNYDHVPEDGNADRFDAARHSDLVTKLATGQGIDEQDSRRFVEDAANRKKSAPINVFIILDISESMEGTPFETAINAATVAYEGLKGKRNAQSPVNVHISTLGGKSMAHFIARPGDKHQDIGKRIAGARGAIGGNTHFLPALKLVLDKAANQKIAKDQPVGQTYVFVVSDCVFTDPQHSTPALVALSHMSDHVNVDFLKIPAKTFDEKQYQYAFEETIEQINAMPNAKNKMGITPVDNLEELSPSMLGMLKQRILGKDQLAKPYGAIQKALKQMNQRL